MSELGTLLELLHDAHSGLNTLAAEYRDWYRPRPSLELYVDRSELGETNAHWRGAGPFPREMVASRRVWLMAPDSLRVEVLHGHELVRLGVRSGARWWRWDRDSGPISWEPTSTDRAPRNPPPLLTPPLLDPARLLGMLRFEALGFSTRAGRATLAAHAVRRHPHPTNPALHYEFEFDAEHGTVLHRAALDEGHVVSVTEAMTVAYEVPIGARLFDFASPDGLPARRLEPDVAERRAGPEVQSLDHLSKTKRRVEAGSPSAESHGTPTVRRPVAN
jgi:hypothetical protein